MHELILLQVYRKIFRSIGIQQIPDPVVLNLWNHDLAVGYPAGIHDEISLLCLHMLLPHRGFHQGDEFVRDLNHAICDHILRRFKGAHM